MRGSNGRWPSTLGKPMEGVEEGGKERWEEVLGDFGVLLEGWRNGKWSFLLGFILFLVV